MIQQFDNFFINKFYLGIKEKEIENIYNNYYKLINPNITCKKEKLGIGTTDGIIRFYDNNSNLLFWILQETKRNVNKNSIWVNRSFLQAIMYLGNVFYDTNTLSVDKFKGIFLNSNYYFGFISKNDLIPIMIKFEPFWNKYYRVRPSEAYIIPELSDFISNIDLKQMMFSLDNNFNLYNIIQDLYKNNI